MISHDKAVTLRLLPIFLLTLVLIAGCSDMGDPVGPANNPPDNTPNGSDTLSWTGDIYPDIISTNCISCHSTATPLGNLDLSNFESWISANSQSGNPFVVPGDPNASELVWRVEGTNGLDRMPQGGQLSDTDIQAIRTWISQGALKDPVAGAGGDGGGGGGDNGGDDYTWVADIFPDVIQTNCAGCHGPSNMQGDLDLTDFDEWINEDGVADNLFVVPGNPDQSELIWRLEGTNNLDRMPLGGQLVAEDIQKVRDWISQGAKKN